MVYSIRLCNGILGWMLVPSYRHSTVGVENLFNLLYGQDWMKMSSSERAFMSGEPVAKVVAHVKEVCKDLKLSVSICGSPKMPTFRIWYKPVVEPESVKVSVDLKWSCWSEDKGIWDEYAPSVYQQMEAAFKGETGPITVHTAPRKEIRYGSVTISKGNAEGCFSTGWDSVEELADTLDLGYSHALYEMIPYSTYLGAPGTDWDFQVKARTFRSLMRKIDQQETELMSKDEREWECISNCAKEQHAY